ncbi:MAG TPA: TIR domain-containing protein, partial [Thermoanaerobaculia bacterium]|nr:TIR domain-containing protein [Thermoanaerobaculia bacterium]
MAPRDFGSVLAFLRKRRKRRAVRVFISYTSRHDADKQLAEKIFNFLESHGADAFFAPVSIEPGDEWRNVLRRRINDCTHFVTIVSEASIHSEEVTKEIRQASERLVARDDLDIVPIEYGNPSFNPFSSKQVIKMTGSDVRQVCAKLLKLLRISPRPAPRAAAGPLVPLLCNREEQEEAVDAILTGDDALETPAVFFIGGFEDDNGESFIDRIIELNLGAGMAAERPPRIHIPWNGGWTRISGLQALRTLIWRKFELPEGEPTATHFARHVSALPSPVFVVTHKLHADEWSIDDTAWIVGKYLDFWDDAAQAETKPLFVLFFQIVYASSSGDTPAPSPSAIRSAIKGVVSAKKRKLRCKVLRDL